MNFYRYRKFLLFLFFLPIWVSCSFFPSVLRTSENEKVAGELLFEDDFSQLDSGWRTWHDEVGSFVDYQNGGLRFFINRPQTDYWSVQKRVYEDVRLEVEALKINGPDNNQFGLICRFQDNDNFYAFLVSSDGYYGILKVQSGMYQLLNADTFQYSDVIRQGRAVNLLQAECVGSGLALSVNGVTLSTVSDSDFEEGKIGLLAGAYDSAGVDVLFDQFKVYQP